MQVCPPCPPDNGKRETWVQFRLGCHATVEWHVLHVVLKPAWAWLGFVLAVKRFWWQLLHVVLSPV